MSLEITEKTRVLLIGASGGIGQALAQALAPTRLTTLSRSADGFDITDAASVAHAAARLPGPFDLIFDATGALVIGADQPEKTIQQIDAAAMVRQFQLNAVGPALLLKHFAAALPKTGPSVFATLSARVGSIGDNRLGGWIGYRAAKAAQNQVVRTAAIEIARRRADAVVVALHPGTVRTPLTERYLGRHPSVGPEVAAANLLSVVSGLTPDDTGGFFDYSGTPVPW